MAPLQLQRRHIDLSSSWCPSVRSFVGMSVISLQSRVTPKLLALEKWYIEVIVRIFGIVLFLNWRTISLNWIEDICTLKTQMTISVWTKCLLFSCTVYLRCNVRHVCSIFLHKLHMDAPLVHTIVHTVLYHILTIQT